MTPDEEEVHALKMVLAGYFRLPRPMPGEKVAARASSLKIFGAALEKELNETSRHYIHRRCDDMINVYTRASATKSSGPMHKTADVSAGFCLHCKKLAHFPELQVSDLRTHLDGRSLESSCLLPDSGGRRPRGPGSEGHPQMAYGRVEPSRNARDPRCA
jgi:hypothetical protein